MTFGLLENFQKNGIKPLSFPYPNQIKDHTEATIYRPIALTSCLCKTMEGMINSRLVWFLESNQLITEYLAGFRKITVPMTIWYG